MRAGYDSICGRCHGDIRKGDDIVPHRSGAFMHRSCASGQDED